LLTSLLLAVLPVGAHAIVQDPDVCSSCGCCVQPNTPTPVRSAPTASARVVRAEREVRVEPKTTIPSRNERAAISRVLHEVSISFDPSVALFLRHCLLLI
jgi:hypothetical protein